MRKSRRASYPEKATSYEGMNSDENVTDDEEMHDPPPSDDRLSVSAQETTNQEPSAQETSPQEPSSQETLSIKLLEYDSESPIELCWTPLIIYRNVKELQNSLLAAQEAGHMDTIAMMPEYQKFHDHLLDIRAMVDKKLEHCRMENEKQKQEVHELELEVLKLEEEKEKIEMQRIENERTHSEQKLENERRRAEVEQRRQHLNGQRSFH